MAHELTINISWERTAVMFPEGCGGGFEWEPVGISLKKRHLNQHLEDVRGESGPALCKSGVLRVRVRCCCVQVCAPSAVAELTRWGSQNPTTPMFR